MHDWFPVQPAEVIAGFLGGVIRAFARRELGWRQVAVSVFVGAICAGYGQPFATSFLAHQGFGTIPAGTAGFVIGLTGLTLVQGIQTAVARWWERKADPGPSAPKDGGQQP